MTIGLKRCDLGRVAGYGIVAGDEGDPLPQLCLPEAMPLEDNSPALKGQVSNGGEMAAPLGGVYGRAGDEASRGPSPTNASTVETLIGTYLASIPLHRYPGTPLLTIT